MKCQLYIYSGIEPGKKGAGNFVSYFLKKLNNKGIDYQVISYNTPDGFFVRWAKKIGISEVLKKSYYFFVQKISKAKNRIKNEKVVLFHPQSIGLDICIDVIQTNQVYLYVLDNFFFCKKSYNYLEGLNSCTLCITDSNAHKARNCNFFPNVQEQETYDLFLETIQNNLERIHFLTQNNNQGLLLKKKFGQGISFRKVGMLIDLEKRTPIDDGIKQYDFLYHNTLSKAKGLHYFLDLAKTMYTRSFVVPYARSEVKKIIPALDDLENVDFFPVTWEKGLADILGRCKIVINPSLWSSPIEGALLKSINYNGCVAVVSSDYGFPLELPDNIVIKLSQSIEKAAETLNQALENQMLRGSYKEKSKKWLNTYIGNVEHSIESYIEEEFELK